MHDVVIVGGGIVGLATAMTLATRRPLRLLVVEAEDRVAAHQTGHNSGVIHAGLYYKPGSLRALNCVRGREALYKFCAEYGVPHDNCGKLIVATCQEQLPALEELQRRGQANGISGIRRLTSQEAKEHEPHVAAVSALHVPVTGIIDYVALAKTYARRAVEHGATLELQARVTAVAARPDALTLTTTRGEFSAKALINCGGLQADRVARLCGVEPGFQIVPFRGEYYELVKDREYLVKNLIYPVPDARFPFLGVHFTRMIKGGVEAGPNAVLALARHGYSWRNWSLRDLRDMALYPGLWKLAGRYWRTGLSEVHRSLSKGAFVRQLQKLIPELRPEDVRPAGSGVRAQALGRDGKIIDDFQFRTAPRMVHVLNAPSPAATASLSIGETIADLAAKEFGWG